MTNDELLAFATWAGQSLNCDIVKIWGPSKTGRYYLVIGYRQPAHCVTWYKNGGAELEEYHTQILGAGYSLEALSKVVMAKASQDS